MLKEDSDDDGDVDDDDGDDDSYREDRTPWRKLLGRKPCLEEAC